MWYFVKNCLFHARTCSQYTTYCVGGWIDCTVECPDWRGGGVEENYGKNKVWAKQTLLWENWTGRNQSNSWIVSACYSTPSHYSHSPLATFRERSKFSALREAFTSMQKSCQHLEREVGRRGEREAQLLTFSEKLSSANAELKAERSDMEAKV